MTGFMGNIEMMKMMMTNFHIHGMQPMLAYMYTVNNQENYSC